MAFRVAASSGRPRSTPEISAPMCNARGFTSIVRARSAMVDSSTICRQGGNLAQKAAFDGELLKLGIAVGERTAPGSCRNGGTESRPQRRGRRDAGQRGQAL